MQPSPGTVLKGKDTELEQQPCHIAAILLVNSQGSLPPPSKLCPLEVPWQRDPAAELSLSRSGPHIYEK